MSLTLQIPEQVRSSLRSNVPDGTRILIVCDDDIETRRLKALLLEAGFSPDCARTVTTGCEAAKSGQFQVVLTTPQLKDGSWRRLTDIANHYDLHFEVLLWAHNFDLADWAEALDFGAFDVLDAVYEQARVAEATKCALWSAYLKGAAPNRTPVQPHLVS